MKIRKPFSTAAFYAAISTIALTIFACSNDSGMNQGYTDESSSSADYTAINCRYPIANYYACGVESVTQCYNLGGTSVSSCSLPSSSSTQSSSSKQSSSSSAITPLLPPNAVIITLKEYEELSSLDGTGSKGDPTVSFTIKTFTNGTSLATSAGKILLNRNDIDYWSGSISDTISINPATDSLIISPKVLEKDALFDDDISPSGGYIKSPFINNNGTAYQSYVSTKDIVSKNSYCSVTYNLKLIRK